MGTRGFSAVLQLLSEARGRERLSHRWSSSWALLCTRCLPPWRRENSSASRLPPPCCPVCVGDRRRRARFPSRVFPRDRSPPRPTTPRDPLRAEKLWLEAHKGNVAGRRRITPANCLSAVPPREDRAPPPYAGTVRWQIFHRRPHTAQSVFPNFRSPAAISAARRRTRYRQVRRVPHRRAETGRFPPR